MNVLHVCGMYVPATEWGGTTTAVAAYAEALARAGVRVEVFTTTARGNASLPPIEPGTRDVNGVRVTYFPAAAKRQSFIAPAMVPALARRLRDFDVVHTHMLWAFPGIAVARLADLRRVPYVVTPHGSLDPWALSQRRWMKRLFLLASEYRTLRHAARVHYTAEAERTSVPRELQRLPSAVIPNIVDATRFTAGDPGASDDILMLGRIHEMKGFDAMIHALPAVVAARPRARLVIAGPDEAGYRAVVERMIDAHGVRAKVHFTGHVDAATRAQLFASSAVLAQPSYRENFGMAVAEAMAAGLPVVVSDRVNICDEITAGDAGITVPREPVALARALIDVLADPARRRRMGANGRRLVEQRYAPAAVAAELIAMYQAIRR
ncbi:MAG: glycosyltransferase [Deltaproteobacteria bacterium]|nr:glycosyltransferase [Deltaproteobacteria bacterium]